MSESKSRVPEPYLSIFCQELHQMIHSGIAPEEGLALLLEDEREGEVRAWLEGLSTRMESGLSLSEALRESGTFPEYMSDMISLAEETGRLEDVLDTLRRHYERKIRMEGTRFERKQKPGIGTISADVLPGTASDDSFRDFPGRGVSPVVRG